ncbi:FIG00480696: hypothetical protein [hydrothermal vent metagenome]|uniref:Regulator of CtrA degradation n=1 Tax=hydrothermal vent metagenome TaxID=652676 RepID=A0A3B0RZH4_9ZZZZ
MAENAKEPGPIREFANSALFYKTFDESMALVQETAAYLDGRGRLESKELDKDTALAYAAESMRLTTRLMQLSSWLLAQRALFKNQLTPDEASGSKYRLTEEENAHVFSGKRQVDLPDNLKDLIERSRTLFVRVRRLDNQLYPEFVPGEEDHVTPIEKQLNRIEEVFGVAVARKPRKTPE